MHKALTFRDLCKNITLMLFFNTKLIPTKFLYIPFQVSIDIFDTVNYLSINSNLILKIIVEIVGETKQTPVAIFFGVDKCLKHKANSKYDHCNWLTKEQKWRLVNRICSMFPLIPVAKHPPVVPVISRAETVMLHTWEYTGHEGRAQGTVAKSTNNSRQPSVLTFNYLKDFGFNAGVHTIPV